jgi:hypothetical protein
MDPVTQEVLTNSVPRAEDTGLTSYELPPAKGTSKVFAAVVGTLFVVMLALAGVFILGVVVAFTS